MSVPDPVLPPAPAELLESPFWLLWGDPYDEGVKMPMRSISLAHSPTQASVRKFQSGTGATYALLQPILKHWKNAGAVKGAGFLFSNRNPFFGIDLDWKKTGQPSPEQLAIIEQFKHRTYIEHSPSGKGVHIIGRADKDNLAAKSVVANDRGIEFYAQGRFFTFTGRPLTSNNCPTELGDVNDLLFPFIRQLRPEVRSQVPSQADDPFVKLKRQELDLALKHLQPDESYDTWIRVGMALHDWDPEVGFELWEAWSRRGKKFKPGEPNERWASFHHKGEGEARTTIATIFRLAKDRGWSRRKKTLQKAWGDEYDEVFSDGESEPIKDPWLPGLLEDDRGLVEAEPLRPIDWAVDQLFAMGYLHVIAGRGGGGKSTLLNALIASLESGEPFLGREMRTTGRTILFSSEQGPERQTLFPGLAAAGLRYTSTLIRPSREFLAKFSIMDHVEVLRQAIRDAREDGRRPVRAVVIDPIGDFLHSKAKKDLDSWRETDVRQALTPLALLAEEEGIALIVVAHMSKADTSALADKIMNSVALVNRARLVYVVGPLTQPGMEEIRTLVTVKRNLGHAPKALFFQLEPVELAPGVVAARVEAIRHLPDGLEDMTAEELLAPQKRPVGRPPKERTDEELLDTTPKRPVGRPPKERTDEELLDTTPKRPVGRPPRDLLA